MLEQRHEQLRISIAGQIKARSLAPRSRTPSPDGEECTPKLVLKLTQCVPCSSTTRPSCNADRQEQESCGSVGHPMTCASPCKFFWKRRGCKDGGLCKRCHICPWSETPTRAARDTPPATDRGSQKHRPEPLGTHRRPPTQSSGDTDQSHSGHTAGHRLRVPETPNRATRDTPPASECLQGNDPGSSHRSQG